MSADLLSEVILKLQSRKGDWKKIAADAGVSYSWLSQLGRGKYRSAPAYVRLQRIASCLNQQQ